MTFLLDVNVLIALIDPAHVTHETTHRWFADEGAQSWATCPLTQNGVIRIVGHRGYPNTPGSPAAVADIMVRLCRLPGHVFWPDHVSLLDPALVRADRLLTAGQVTDTYLLALAAAQGGRLATHDKHIAASCVIGGQAALNVI